MFSFAYYTIPVDSWDGIVCVSSVLWQSLKAAPLFFAVFFSAEMVYSLVIRNIHRLPESLPRYMTIDRSVFDKDRKNMIILITGASHTGKTLLAQRMLEKYRYPYLSIDHLKMGLIRSGYTALTPEDDDALTEYLWPVVREIVKTAVENKQNLIVEGCYIPSDWRKDFDERYLPFIRFICLAMTEEYFDRHFGEILAHESDIESRPIEGSCSINDLKECNRWFIDAFGSAGEKVVLVEDDYDRIMANLMD